MLDTYTVAFVALRANVWKCSSTHAVHSMYIDKYPRAISVLDVAIYMECEVGVHVPWGKTYNV